MSEYNLNIIKLRNPWLPLIFFLIGYPFLFIMGFISGFITTLVPALGIILLIITFIGTLFFFLYSLDRIYRINLDLIQIDSLAPSKNSWVAAILLSFILIGIPYFWYLLFKFSKSTNRISNDEIPVIVSFLLLLFIFPLGVTYSQYKLNKLPRYNTEPVSEENNNSNNEPISQENNYNNNENINQ